MYLNFPAVLLAICREKWVKRNESKQMLVFIDGYLDEPPELERVVSAEWEMTPREC